MKQGNRILQLSAAVSLFFMMGSCTAIGNWADNVGEHMPVIGERCEHWQCFTASGQAASDANKKQMQQQKAQNANTNATASAPTPAPAPTPPPSYPDMPDNEPVMHH